MELDLDLYSFLIGLVSGTIFWVLFAVGKYWYDEVFVKWWYDYQSNRMTKKNILRRLSGKRID